LKSRNEAIQSIVASLQLNNNQTRSLTSSQLNILAKEPETKGLEDYSERPVWTNYHRGGDLKEFTTFHDKVFNDEKVKRDL
jgi:hypothetical protein